MNEHKKSWGKVWAGAAVLAVIHLVLALVFASRTPFMTPGHVFMQGGGEEGIYTIDIGAPDELQHVVQIGMVDQSKSYPVLNPKDPKLNMTYEALQPPLFYYVTAGWARMTGASTPGEFALYLKSNSYENAERMLNEQSFFTQINRTPADVKQDGMKLRALSAVTGSATVFGVFALALWGLGNRYAAYAAAGFAALLPMNIALSGAVSNDPLLICLCTWVLALLVREARHGLTVKGGILIGVLTGLAFLTKTTALGLIPVIGIALIFSRGTLPFKKFAPGLAVAILLGCFFWVRNQSLYGDPFAIKIFNEAFQGRNPTAEGFISRMGQGAYWSSVFQIMGYSFVGVFSYMDIYMEPWVYSASKWLFILLGLGGLAVIFVPSLKEQPEEGEPSFRTTHIINGVFLVVMLVLFIQFNRGFFQAQARYIMPAIGPIGCLFGLGIGAVCRKGKTFLPLALWFVVLLIFFAQAAVTLTPGFKLRVDQGISAGQNASN